MGLDVIVLRHNHYPATTYGAASDSWHATFYDGDEPNFDVEKEGRFQLKHAAGDATHAPRPPHTGYGPGGQRFVTNDDLDRSVYGRESAEDTLEKLSSKDAIRGAKKRVEKAKKRLAQAEKLLAMLLDADNQRVFDAETWDEIKP